MFENVENVPNTHFLNCRVFLQSPIVCLIRVVRCNDIYIYIYTYVYQHSSKLLSWALEAVRSLNTYMHVVLGFHNHEIDFKCFEMIRSSPVILKKQINLCALVNFMLWGSLPVRTCLHIHVYKSLFRTCMQMHSNVHLHMHLHRLCIAVGSRHNSCLQSLRPEEAS